MEPVDIYIYSAVDWQRSNVGPAHDSTVSAFAISDDTEVTLMCTAGMISTSATSGNCFSVPELAHPGDSHGTASLYGESCVFGAALSAPFTFEFDETR